MKPFDLGVLIVLAAIWGASFMIVRVVVPVLGPFDVVELRLLLGGLFLLGYALWTGRGLEPERWREYLILGAFNAAIPFVMISFALLHITVAMSTILNAMAPLFAALVGLLWTRQAVSVGQTLGLLLGVLGVAVLVGWSPVTLTPLVLLAILAALTTAFCFGFSSVFARKYSRGSPLPTVTGQLFGGALLLVIPVLASPPPQAITGGTVALVVVLSIVATAIGNLMFFYLIDSVGATGASSVGFLVPGFGIFWSWLFLGEQLTWSVVLGLALILLSVALVNNLLTIPRKADSLGQ